MNTPIAWGSLLLVKMPKLSLHHPKQMLVIFENKGTCIRQSFPGYNSLSRQIYFMCICCHLCTELCLWLLDVSWYMIQHIIWLYPSQCRATKAHTSLCTYKDSPEPSLLADIDEDQGQTKLKLNFLYFAAKTHVMGTQKNRLKTYV